MPSLLFFLLRKTCPVLSSVPIFLNFIWDPATALPDKWCLSACPGSEPRPPAEEHAHLTTTAWGHPSTIIDDEEIREGLTDEVIFEHRTEYFLKKTNHIVGKKFSRDGNNVKGAGLNTNSTSQ